MAARGDAHHEVGIGMPGHLPVLSKWPAAHCPDEDCVIDDEIYPAPARLGAREVLWWIDRTEIRVGASRNLLNGSMGAILGALLGSIATVIGSATTSTPWGAVAGAGVSIVLVAFAARTMLKDSDHAPLEQRLLLYRQRARDLGVL